MRFPSRPTLAFTLLMAMLAVVLLFFGGTVLFANWAVQREFQRLPPEAQNYLRFREEAARNRQAPPLVPPLPESLRVQPLGPELPNGRGNLTPNVSTLSSSRSAAQDESARWRALRARLPPLTRNRDFLANIQGIVWQVGLLMAFVSAMLAWLLARRIAQPLTRVSRAAQQLAAGDLNARAPIIKGEREVVDLALNFNQMAHSLQEMDSQRQRTAADIAHELRTPIAVIQARLDAIEDGIYPLEKAQVTTLSQQTQLLSRLVDDLRTLTLAEAGQLRIRKEAFDLQELCRRVTTDLQDRAQARGLRLEFSVNAETSPEFLGDPDRIRQIVLNLLENALGHAQAHVQLTLTSSASQSLLVVDDDGPGIPEQAAEQVFTRFTRLDASRSRETGGSGLGLSIVRAFVQAHGGSVAALSSPLGGARLMVSLPVLSAIG